MRGRGVPSSPRQPTPADSNGGCSSLLPDLSLRPISEPMSGPISGPYHHTATDACTPLPPPPPRRFSDGHGSHGQLLSPSSGLPPPPPMTPGSYLPSTPDAHSPLPPPPPRRLTEGHDNHGRITSPLPGPLPPPLSEPHHSTTDGRTPLPPPLPRRLSTDQESHHEGSTVLPPPPPPVVSTDPRLDFLSAQFDCVLALNTLGLLPPNPRAVPLDYVEKCRQLLPQSDPNYRPATDRTRLSKTKIARIEQATRSSTTREDQIERQPPLQVLAAKVCKGPLLLLRRAYEDKGLIRLVTRHARGVRGVAIGTLVGFDYHMNLLLRDVKETYTVLLKVCRIIPARDSGQAVGDGSSTVYDSIPDNLRLGERIRWGKKQEVRQRSLKQVFVRGDNVVLVSLVEPVRQSDKC